MEPLPGLMMLVSGESSEDLREKLGSLFWTLDVKGDANPRA